MFGARGAKLKLWFLLFLFCCPILRDCYFFKLLHRTDSSSDLKDMSFKQAVLKQRLNSVLSRCCMGIHCDFVVCSGFASFMCN